MMLRMMIRSITRPTWCSQPAVLWQTVESPWQILVIYTSIYFFIFQYTIPAICRNPVCANRRRFMLDADKSVFVDFQKIRIQETQAELPRGCIPRSLEVILRAEAVESVQVVKADNFLGK